MVIKTYFRREAATLTIELVVALAIVVLAMFPLTYSIVKEYKIQHGSYQRAVAMELVDGEMEILAAGEWRAFKEGSQSYTFHGASVKNLPSGQATLTIKGNYLRLGWISSMKGAGGEVHREVVLPDNSVPQNTTSGVAEIKVTFRREMVFKTQN